MQDAMLEWEFKILVIHCDRHVFRSTSWGDSIMIDKDHREKGLQQFCWTHPKGNSVMSSKNNLWIRMSHSFLTCQTSLNLASFTYLHAFSWGAAQKTASVKWGEMLSSFPGRACSLVFHVAPHYWTAWKRLSKRCIPAYELKRAVEILLPIVFIVV